MIPSTTSSVAVRIAISAPVLSSSQNSFEYVRYGIVFERERTNNSNSGVVTVVRFKGRHSSICFGNRVDFHSLTMFDMRVFCGVRKAVVRIEAIVGSHSIS